MTRRHIAFSCQGATLWGTLDCAALHGPTGLLIVSGGNEIRSGAFAGAAHLAADLAQDAGIAVFRYDRRGIGDSEGDNAGWRGSAEDIAAALAAFRRAMPGMRRVIGYGLCDGAAALMLHGVGFDGLVLANPWTYEGDDAPDHSASDLRRRYWQKLRDPRAVARLLTGRVNLARLARGLGRAASGAAATSLADSLRESLARFAGPVSILISDQDRTGARFAEVWGDDPRVISFATASHSMLDDPAAREWLIERIAEATASRH